MTGRRSGGRAGAGDRGAATVLVIACLALLLLVGGALGVVTAMVRAHRMAQSAADLSALAGAAALQRGEPPCVAAEEVATANAARLDSCAQAGSEVTVATTVTGPRWLGQTGDLTAQARAGPR